MVTSSFLRHVRLLLGEGPPYCIEFSGVLAPSGPNVRALYIGSGANQDFLLGLVMDEPREQRRERLSGYRAVRALLRSTPAETDVVLTDLPPWAPLPRIQAQFRFPAWIKQELRLISTGRWTLARAVEREAARLARRYQYSVDFTGDPAQLRRFYHELYRPYVLARFESGAIVVNEGAFLRVGAGGTLARLHRQGEWVAGMLLEHSSTKLRFRWFGAAGAPPPPGASDVLDVAVIRQAHSWGIRRIHLGHSRPSLIDGSLRYKAKLGGEIQGIRYPQAKLGITVQGLQQRALFERLHRQQLFTIDRGQPRILLAA